MSNDVIPLGEEGDPVIQDALLLVAQVLPVGEGILGLGGRLA